MLRKERKKEMYSGRTFSLNHLIITHMRGFVVIAFPLLCVKSLAKTRQPYPWRVRLNWIECCYSQIDCAARHIKHLVGEILFVPLLFILDFFLFFFGWSDYFLFNNNHNVLCLSGAKIDKNNFLRNFFCPKFFSVFFSIWSS